MGINWSDGLTVAKVAGKSIYAGLKNTAKDLTQAGECLAKKDYKGAGNVAYRHCARKVKAMANLAGMVGQTAWSSAKRKYQGREVFQGNNRRRMIMLCGVAVAAIIAHEVADELYSDTYELVDVDELAGVEHGMLVDDSQLDEIINMGKIEDTEHIPAEDIIRSEAVRMDFLQAHGYDKLPDGYEIHHIIPLSEGGADSPENMILLTEEQHDIVTAAHAGYYGWNRHS